MSARLIEALERIARATPSNTNNHSAKAMCIWTRTVAQCALDEHAAALAAARESTTPLIDAVRAHRAKYGSGLKQALDAVRNDGWRPSVGR